ncbi:acyl-homoserine-lactone synthase [Consotaella aegiceratis]|uniref:acyl-homoserine-lactone synthase n=1 Tax=Consotaella aegiceratis TaxID=3097961 RepID=UPI002F3EE17A
MLTLLEPYQFAENAGILEKMFRLRARVFHDKLGWDVQVVDGLEKDQYDEMSPVYLIMLDDSKREVLASARFLPTSGPTLITDTFSETMGDDAQFSSPTIWECTRFCIDEDLLETMPQGAATAASISSLMLIGCGEFAIKSGIEGIVANFDAAMFRIYRRAGAELTVLGSSSRFGERPVYAGIFHIAEDICERMRVRAGVRGPVLADPREALPNVAAAA